MGEYRVRDKHAGQPDERKQDVRAGEDDGVESPILEGGDRLGGLEAHAVQEEQPRHCDHDKDVEGLGGLTTHWEERGEDDCADECCKEGVDALEHGHQPRPKALGALNAGAGMGSGRSHAPMVLD